MTQKALNFILALLGTFTAVPGVLEILFALTGRTFSWGKIGFQGDFTLWRGLILLASGVFYFSAIYIPGRTEKRAQAVLASLMIWIVGGMRLLSIFLESIPGGKGRWLSTASGFLDSYSGPFIPAIFLLPLSIAFVVIVLKREGKNEE